MPDMMSNEPQLLADRSFSIPPDIYSEGPDDPSDIPVVVVRKHVCSQGSSLSSGFETDGDGTLIRTRSGEDIEAVAELDHDEEEDLGQGQRRSKKPKRYGGDEMWKAT